MDKYHREDVVGIKRENKQDENYKSKTNPQIDKARTPNNYHNIGRTETYLSYIDKRIKEIAPKRKIKDDAVLIISFILGSDGKFFASLTLEQQKEFFSGLRYVFCRTLRRKKYYIRCRPHGRNQPAFALELNPSFRRTVMFQETLWKESSSGTSNSFPREGW